MKTCIDRLKRKVFVSLILLFLVPIAAFCKSDFKVAYKVDDQIITNYDIDQAKKLNILLTGSNLNRADIEKIVVSSKIKEIYGNRLQIIVSNAELDTQLNSFLKSNKMNVGGLKSLMNSKGIDIETFYNFMRENIRWQKVLDKRFGYKINNLAIKDAMPLTPTPRKMEKQYEFYEIFISYKQWDPQQANLIASRLEIELKAGANFDKAVEKFSSAESKINKGKVGPIKKSTLPNKFREVLDGLKKNEISSPFEINGGLILLKLKRTQSYKTAKTPNLLVTFSVSNTTSLVDAACSQENNIRGPVSLSKVEKNIRNILAKLMPGESYKLSDKSGSISLITLCERFINEKKSGSLSFENMKKNEEALRLSNALMLELRRNTTVVKK